MKDTPFSLIDIEKLQKARGLRGLSAVAREVGVSYQYMWMLETGKRVPSLQVLARLCDIYGIGIADLLVDQKKLRAA